MPEISDEPTPVGVVPRRKVRSIEQLMSDAPAPRTVAEAVEPSPQPASPGWARWLPSVTAVTAVAGALEWLKLTR